MSLLRALANFLFPPIMGYFSAKASQDKFESQIYRSALVGSLVGFFVGFMTTVALVTMGPFGPFPLLNSLVGAGLLTYGLPIFIGIPWLFSIIGRGLGFVHGIRHTLTSYGSSYIKPNNIAGVACIFALTGESFVNEFYTHFYQPNIGENESLLRTLYLRKMNEIGCLNRVVRETNFAHSLFPDEDSANLLSELHGIGFINNSEAGQAHLQFVFSNQSWIKPIIDLMQRHPGLFTHENLELLYQSFRNCHPLDESLYPALNHLSVNNLLSNPSDDPDYAQKNFRAIVQAPYYISIYQSASDRKKLAEYFVQLHNKEQLSDQVRNSLAANPNILNQLKPIHSNISPSFSAPKNFEEDVKETKNIKSLPETKLEDLTPIINPPPQPTDDTTDDLKETKHLKATDETSEHSPELEDHKDLAPVITPSLKPADDLQTALTQLSEYKIDTSENIAFVMEIGKGHPYGHYKQNFTLVSKALVDLHEAGILDTYRKQITNPQRPPQHVEDIASGLVSLHKAKILDPQNAALLTQDQYDSCRPIALRTAQALIKLHQANLLKENRDFLSQSKLNTAEGLANALIELHAHGISITPQIRSILHPNLVPFMTQLHKANILEKNMKFITDNVQALKQFSQWNIEKLSNALQELHSHHMGILPQHYDLIISKLTRNTYYPECLMIMLNELKKLGIDTQDNRDLVIHYLNQNAFSTTSPSFIKLLHDEGILEDYRQVIQENIEDAQTLSEGIVTLHKAKLLDSDTDLKEKTKHPCIKYILMNPAETTDRVEIIKILQGTPHLNEFLERTAKIPAHLSLNYLQGLQKFELLQSKEGKANLFYVTKAVSCGSVVFKALDALQKAGLLTKENTQTHFDKLFMWEIRGCNVASVIITMASLGWINHLNSENLELVYKNARYANEVENAFSLLIQNSSARAFDPNRSTEKNVRNRVKVILEKADRTGHIKQMIKNDPDILRDPNHLLAETNISSFIAKALQEPHL